MKTKLKIFAFILTFLSISMVFAHRDKYKRVSPPDSVRTTTNDSIHITMNYSKPSLNGRQFDIDLAKFGELWRTGANEITWISFDKDVKVEGGFLPAGKYGLWTFPEQNQTTVIFSKIWKGWGINYNNKMDKLRIKVKNSLGNPITEQFTISVDPAGKINLAWGK